MEKNKCKKRITKEEQVEWFRSSSVSELTKWVRRFLENQDTTPLVLFLGDMEPDIYLKNYIYSMDDLEIKEKFQITVYELFRRWSFGNNDSIELLFYLLNLIGFTRNIKCFEKLVLIAMNQQFKEIFYGDYNIHERILAVLFGLEHHDPRIELIAHRDIEDCRFVNLCFRKIIELTGDILHVASHLPLLFECKKEFSINLFTFKRFIKIIGYQNLVNHYEQIYLILDSENRKTFNQYLDSLNLIRIFKESKLYLYVSGEKRIFCTEIMREDILLDNADQETGTDIRNLEIEIVSQIKENVIDMEGNPNE